MESLSPMYIKHRDAWYFPVIDSRTLPCPLHDLSGVNKILSHAIPSRSGSKITVLLVKIHDGVRRENLYCGMETARECVIVCISKFISYIPRQYQQQNIPILVHIAHIPDVYLTFTINQPKFK